MTDFNWPRLNPELAHALRVILGAIFEEAPLSAREARAEHAWKRAVKSVKKPGGVKKKRPAKGRAKKATKKAYRPRNCRSMSIHGERCVLHGSHAGDHRDRKHHVWHTAQRTKKRKVKGK